MLSIRRITAASLYLLLAIILFSSQADGRRSSESPSIRKPFCKFIPTDPLGGGWKEVKLAFTSAEIGLIGHSPGNVSLGYQLNGPINGLTAVLLTTATQSGPTKQTATWYIKLTAYDINKTFQLAMDEQCLVAGGVKADEMETLEITFRQAT